jgi:CRISPR-associated endonuclease/helicase Cas3
MAHQAATVAALRHSSAPIIINRAMTGDGKSFAGQFTFFNEPRTQTFTMYPTNELARDQQRSLDALLADWTPQAWGTRSRRRYALDARALDELETALDASRSGALERVLAEDALLTNPDIFHLIMQFRYRDRAAAADHVLAKLVQRFSLYIFDEFHLFGAPETASVMIALLLMRAIASAQRPPRFLFLSATASDHIQRMAQEVDLGIAAIEGDYRHGENRTPPGYRRILQPVTLHTHTDSLEAWVDQHSDDIIAFFRDHPQAAKGAIIANSVGTAHRVHARLQPLFRAALGRDVGINTGITARAVRATTDDYDLIVATSTVDVGVDFRINYLVFESLDAASHIQRLGRLGRHDRPKGGTQPFATFEAHALLPKWVEEGLEQRFASARTVSRADYETALRGGDGREALFPAQQDFHDYITRWAGLQAAHVLQKLGSGEIRTQYETIRASLDLTYNALFPRYKKHYIDLKTTPAVLQAARSFRGSNAFSALVINPAESNEVISYNLISLLRQAELEALDIEHLLRQAESTGQTNSRALRNSEPLAAYRLHGWLEKYRELSISVRTELSGEMLENVIDLHGLSLDVTPGVAELSKLNDLLMSRVLAVMLVPNKQPQDVRRMCRAGIQIELLPFKAGNLHGTIAIGRDALLLDSVWRRQQSAGSRRAPPMII